MSVTEKTPFSLEMDDRTDDERAQRQSDLIDPLDPPPMDSNYDEDLGDTKKKIRFNVHFLKSENKDPREPKKFDIKQLFEAAASGNVAQLQGLQHYLQRIPKYLSNSEYQEKNGKNALLKALLNLKNGRNDTIKYLLDISEQMGDLDKFVNATYIDSFYKGQSALHIAIERRSFHFVKLLVQKGADVHAKACGKFFQRNKGACFYFGELPLSLAACTNQLDIVEFLMDNPYQKVRVTEKDSEGNMVLHALVIIADNTPENTDFVIMMYDEILTRAAKHHPKIKLEDIENNQGLTPIKLAAKTGKIGLFRHMMQREFQDPESRYLSRKFTEWVYGPVHSSLYDMASIDSCEKNSVLEIIVYGSGIPNRCAMLDIGPLSRLLEEKWNRFARWIFNFNFLVYLVYLIIFSLVAYNRQEEKLLFDAEHSTFDYLLLTGKIISAVGALYFFIKGIVDFIRKPPTRKAMLEDGFSDVLFFLQAVLFFLTVALYFTWKEAYVACLVGCLSVSWVNLLYFSRGYKSLGIYSVMMQKMILSELLRFVLVYMVFLFGFSAAVVTLLDEPPRPPIRNATKQSRFVYSPIEASPNEEQELCKKPTFRSIQFAILELFKFTIGMGEMEFTEKYQNKVAFYALLISYILLTYILLMNMMIALMSKKAEDMSKESTSIWKLQRAITTLDVERTLPCCLKDRLRIGVQKRLGGLAGEEKRWCLRVEEVNWNKWNTDLGIVEDPGRRDFWGLSHSERPGWRRTLRNFKRKSPNLQREHEMSSMSTSVTHEGTTVYHMPP